MDQAGRGEAGGRGGFGATGNMHRWSATVWRTTALWHIHIYIPIYYILTYSVYPEFVPEYLQKRGLGLRIGLRIKGLRIGLRIKKHSSLLCAPKCRLASLPPTGKQTNWSIAQLRGRQPLREKQGPRDKYIETRSPLVRTRVCASNWVCTHM